MYYDDEPSEIIGDRCTLIEDYKGYSDGEIVGDFGDRVVVRLNNGCELVCFHDEILIYD